MEKRLGVLADTSGIIALLDKSDHYHNSVLNIVSKEDILIPSIILPEVDYLATKYLGDKAFLNFLEDLFDGYFTYISVEVEDLKRASLIMQKYQDVYLGIVDSSVAALAERLRIRKILTLDRRHFCLIKPESIDYFELLP
jgi:uncharacterized protein